MLADVDNCHCRSWTQNLANSCKPGIVGVLQSSRMILNRALDSEVLVDHKVLKQGSSVIELSELFFQNTTVTAVIKSLVWNSEISSLNYRLCFGKAPVVDIPQQPSSVRACAECCGVKISPLRLH